MIYNYARLIALLVVNDSKNNTIYAKIFNLEMENITNDNFLL